MSSCTSKLNIPSQAQGSTLPILAWNWARYVWFNSKRDLISLKAHHIQTSLMKLDTRLWERRSMVNMKYTCNWRGASSTSRARKICAVFVRVWTFARNTRALNFRALRYANTNVLAPSCALDAHPCDTEWMMKRSMSDYQLALCTKFNLLHYWWILFLTELRLSHILDNINWIRIS